MVQHGVQLFAPFAVAKLTVLTKVLVIFKYILVFRNHKPGTKSLQSH